MPRADVIASARVALTFAGAAEARAIGAALAVDNPGEAVSQKVEGRRVLLEVRAGAVLSLRATLDDWLRCAAAAQALAARATASAPPSGGRKR